MRHLLDTKDLSREEAIQILDIAESMTDATGKEIKKFPTLRGLTCLLYTSDAADD